MEAHPAYDVACICHRHCLQTRWLWLILADQVATLPASNAHGLFALHMQALSNSIDGAAALLDCFVDAISALVQLLQQLPADQDTETAVAAMQCLSNLTRSRKGVEAALQAQLPLCVVTFVTEVLQLCPDAKSCCPCRVSCAFAA